MEQTDPRDAEGTRPAKAGIDPRVLVRVALVAMGALFLFLIYSGGHIRELVDPDAMDYAQIARHLSRGEGFTTSWVRPLSLGQVQNVSHHPELLRAPAHPALMAIVFRFLGANYRAVAWASGVPYLLSLPLVYLLALRLFGRREALLALGLFAVNGLVLQYAVSGLETSLATLFVTGLLLLLQLYLSAEKPSPLLAAACGATLGLAALTNYLLIALVVPILPAMLLSGGGKRWREAALAIGACALVMAPWAIRNMRVAGRPLATIAIADYVTDPTTDEGLRVYREYLDAAPSPLRHTVENRREVFEKARRGALELYRAMDLNLGGPLVLAFFVAGVFMHFKVAGLPSLRAVHYAAIGLMAVIGCLMSAYSRALVPLCPFAIVIASACFIGIVDAFAERIQGPKRKRRAVTWSVVALLALSWFPAVAGTITKENQDTGIGDELRALTSQVAESGVGVVYTDQPWVLAWYGDMDAIWLPEDETDLDALEADIGPVQGVLLSPFIASAQSPGLAAWGQLYRAAAAGQRLRAPYTPVAPLGGSGGWWLFARTPEGTDAEETDATTEAPTGAE